jgi:hypothetical protein
LPAVAKGRRWASHEKRMREMVDSFMMAASSRENNWCIETVTLQALESLATETDEVVKHC